jgi:translation initiation factor IF-1
MVKNTFGGSSHKKFARSSVAPSTKTFLRTAREDGELYAYVNKMYGNGMCNVVDMDGKEYLCIIRGKFRGKNKKFNKLELGTWLLVGLRGWETTKKDEKLTCDLLEIYTKEEIDRLKATVRGNWKTECETSVGDEVELGSNVVFNSNDDEFEYEEMMKKETEGGGVSKKISLVTTSSKNDWLREDGDGEGEGEGDGEGDGDGEGAIKSRYMPKHINRRIAEYVDFDSI